MSTNLFYYCYCGKQIHDLNSSILISGCTPLYLAAQNNKPAMIRLLAKESVNPNIHCQGYSPLGIAAMNGRTQALRFGAV
jgi:ankyrin repeat protein